MIKLRHQQPSLWNRGVADDIEDSYSGLGRSRCGIDIREVIQATSTKPFGFHPFTLDPPSADSVFP